MEFNENESSIFCKLLEAGHSVSIVPKGTSMLPLLDGKSDSVIIDPVGEAVRKNDIVFYTDKSSRLVVHRIWGKNEDGFILLGDGNIEKEFSIQEQDIHGVCSKIIRGGKEIPVSSFGYRIYASLWRLLYPFRRYILILINFFNKG